MADFIKYFLLSLFITAIFYPPNAPCMQRANEELGERRPLLGSPKRASAPRPQLPLYNIQDGTVSLEVHSLDPSLLKDIEPQGITKVVFCCIHHLILGNPRNPADLPLDMLSSVGRHFPQTISLSIKHCIVPSNSLDFGAFKNLVTLSLRYAKLGPHSTQALVPLTGLVELDLTGNLIGDHGLEPLGQLPFIKTLNVSHTRITEKGLSHLAGLRNLTSLDLAINKIGRSPNVQVLGVFTFLEERESCLLPLRSLIGLTLLDLTGINDHSGACNFITPIDVASLSCLGKLQVLKLGRHPQGKYSDTLQPLPLSGRPVFLRGLTELRELSAQQSGITDEGLEEVAMLPQLQQLDLSDVSSCTLSFEDKYLNRPQRLDHKMNGSHLFCLRKLPLLTHLSLSCQAIGENAIHLGELTSLIELKLSDTLLREDDIASFRNLVGLKRLTLSYNKIGVGTRHLSSLNQLEELDLIESEIDDTAFCHLVGMSGLTKIKIHSGYGRLTPHSLENIVAFIRNSKVTSFDLGNIFPSNREKTRKIRSCLEMSYISHAERNKKEQASWLWDVCRNERRAVWTPSDILRLRSELAPNFPITFSEVTEPSGTCDCCSLQ